MQICGQLCLRVDILTHDMKVIIHCLIIYPLRYSYNSINIVRLKQTNVYAIIVNRLSLVCEAILEVLLMRLLDVLLRAILIVDYFLVGMWMSYCYCCLLVNDLLCLSVYDLCYAKIKIFELFLL